MVVASVMDNMYVTTDGGTSWAKTKLSSAFGVYGDPALVVDRKANFYAFHRSNPSGAKDGFDSAKLDRLIIHQSSDDGATWTETGFAGLNAPKDQDREWPAVDGKGNLYLTWTEFDKYGDANTDCHSRILFSKSKSGSKWATPVEISQAPGTCSDNDDTAKGPMPVISNQGRVYIAWASQGNIFMDRSYDGGSTWLTNDIRIAEQRGGWDIKIPGHDRSNGLPVLAVNNSFTNVQSHLYVLWADTRNGENNADIWFIASGDDGDHWTTPLKVNNDNSGHHQYLPWMTVDQATGYIYVIFYDRRAYDDNQTDVYLAYSIDDGKSFTNVKISDAPFTPVETSFFGSNITIAAANGTIVPVWTRMDDGRTSIWTAIIKQEELIKTSK